MSSRLVAEHGRWLMAFLMGLMGNAPDAEDAFQEVWLRVFKARGRNEPASYRAYLAKTARAVVIDRFRRRRPEESLDARTEADEAGCDPVDPTPGPDARLESKATAEDVRRAIAALPFNWRQVVLLRIEGELEFREIAEELGVPLGTTLTWMRRATARLKHELGGEG